MDSAPTTPDIDEEPTSDNPQDGGTGDDEGEESLGTQSEVEVLGPCKLKIKAEVPKEKVVALLSRNYRDLISTLQIPGFRRGKVPRQLVEKRYGGDIEKDLKEALLNDSFIEIIKDKDLKVVGRPKFDQIEFKKEEPFRYFAEVEIQPEFELPEYRGIEVKEEKIPVTPESIDHELQHLRERHGALAPVDLAVAGSADFIIGSYRLLKDGEEVQASAEAAFKPEKGEVDGIIIEGLKEAFEGRGQNSTLQLSAKVPAGHATEKLRGETVTAEIKIQDAKRIQLPELDDEFAKNFQLESLDKLRQHVEEVLKERHARQEHAKIEDQVLARIIENVQFELPEGLLDDQKKTHQMRMEYEMIQNGQSRESIEASIKDAATPAEDEIRKQMKEYFVLEKIAEKEKIFATEEDIEERIHQLSEVYRRRGDEIFKELEQSGRLGELRAAIKQKKVRQFLREKANITS